jgi:hypothetical protein
MGRGWGRFDYGDHSSAQAEMEGEGKGKDPQVKGKGVGGTQRKGKRAPRSSFNESDGRRPPLDACPTWWITSFEHTIGCCCHV